MVMKESSKGPEDPKPKKLKQTYKLRDVVKEIHRQRIEDEIPYESTDPKYLGCYQRALTKILEQLSEDELEEAERTLISWNKEGVPASMQLK
jgi:hypothetical protein